MAMDRALFLGHDPWRLLQPVLGTPAVTTAFNAGYHMWFFFMFAFWLGAAFSFRAPELRLKYITACILAWAVGGAFLATVLSSAGPCFWDLLELPGRPFTELMAYLHAANEVSPVWALNVQAELWKSYQGEDALVGGISAMPSMHVASSVLFAVMGFAVSRALGWLMVAFNLVILIGSVHLGYHYVVDGIAGIAIALAAWRLAGWLVSRDRATAPGTV